MLGVPALWQMGRAGRKAAHMIAYETLRAIAIRARAGSITLNIEGHGIKTCPAPAWVVQEASEFRRWPLEVSGLVARGPRGRIVSFTVQSLTVLRESELASAAVLL